MTEAAKAAAQAAPAGAKPAAAKAPEPDGRSKVMIVLTDGENNAGKLSPEDAARLAQTLKVKVYTILAGAKESDAEPNAPGGHHSVNPKLLEQIASMTGGTPYLATDSRALRGPLPEDPRGAEAGADPRSGPAVRRALPAFPAGRRSACCRRDRAPAHAVLEDSLTCASSAPTRSGSCCRSRRR